jgi:hypothetical protein
MCPWIALIREKFKHIMMERSVSGSAGVRFVIDTQRTREWRGVCQKRMATVKTEFSHTVNS